MLYLHPVWQALAGVAALYALWLGAARFYSLHLNRRTLFRRKRHVLLGKLALSGWLLGLAGGGAAARFQWGAVGLSGGHAVVAGFMLPLLVFGLASGIWMERRPARRWWLPLWHGTNNLLLVLAALYQSYLGWGVLREFVWL